MNFNPIAQCDRALYHAWIDIGELNYWATKMEFQRIEELELVENK